MEIVIPPYTPHSSFQIICRVYNRNTHPRMQSQQACIAGNDKFGSPVQRDFQELVVLRIAALADQLNDGYELDRASDLRENKSAIPPACVTIELRAAENFVSSFIVSSEKITTPWSKAWSTTRRGVERGKMTALANTLVSRMRRPKIRMNRRASIFQNVGKYFFSHCASGGLNTDTIHSFLKLATLNLRMR